MSEKNLIILTHGFPVQHGEEFLIDELDVTAAYFKKIWIFPNLWKKGIESRYTLPLNVSVNGRTNVVSTNSISLSLRVILILLSEFFRIGSKRIYFKLFKFNLSLLKQSYLKALQIISVIPDHSKTIIYSYWCDDLALTGAFCKLLRPELKFISRAHGFDVFEEQSDFNHIFFRSFQLSKLDRLWTVSKAGAAHLKLKNPDFDSKIGLQYLGIKSSGDIFYETTELIRIVTCSHIRSIKRLDLLVKALRLSRGAKIEWHVIGAGEDLEYLRKAAESLPRNCITVFHGHLTTDRIHQLYSQVHFDFLVSLSSSEGLPVSMMEAISHGIPVLATDVGGCKEIVNQATGVLIDSGFSDEELMNIILNCKKGYFNDKKRRQEIVEYWEKHFNSKMNYEKFAEEILTIKSNK